MSIKKRLYAMATVVALVAASCSSGGTDTAASDTDTTGATDNTTASAETETDKEEKTPTPPDETFGITPELLQQYDLEAQIPELAGNEIRARIVTFEPGGATNAHDHTDRPGMVYVLEGSLTEHRGDTSTIYEAGDSWVEGVDADHWVENHTDAEAVILTADIRELTDEEVEAPPAVGTEVQVDQEPTAEPSGIELEELGLLDLGEQIPSAKGITYRLRKATFAPGAIFPEHSHTDRPGLGYVLEGEYTDVRTDGALVFSEGESWSEVAETEHWSTNQAEEDAVILLFDIVVEEG